MTPEEKLVSKLVEYNEKANAGKEINVVDYFKKLDPKGTFMKSFVM